MSGCGPIQVLSQLPYAALLLISLFVWRLTEWSEGEEVMQKGETDDERKLFFSLTDLRHAGSKSLLLEPRLSQFPSLLFHLTLALTHSHTLTPTPSSHLHTPAHIPLSRLASSNYHPRSPMEATQLFRLAGGSDIEEIACDHVNVHTIIYWEDIEQVFPGAKCVKLGNVYVKLLRDSNENR